MLTWCEALISRWTRSAGLSSSRCVSLRWPPDFSRHYYRHAVGLVPLLLDRDEFGLHFWHYRLADTPIWGDGCGGEARVRICGRNIVQRRLRSCEDRTRARS